MRFKIVRFFVLLFLIFGYSWMCRYAYSYSNNVVKAYNKDNLKTSNNYISMSSEIEDTENNDYLGFVSIPKIGVSRHLYNIDSKENTVDKNIQVIKQSDMPDAQNGNFIIAAHNGDSSIAYFHDLDKLDLDDEVIVTYNGADYRYFVSDKYDVKKTGKVAIKRDKNRKAITMVTCKGEDRQLVVIGYEK